MVYCWYPVRRKEGGEEVGEREGGGEEGKEREEVKRERRETGRR